MTSLIDILIVQLMILLIDHFSSITTSAIDICIDLIDRYRVQLHRIASVDTTWAYSNGLNAHNNPAWLRLYLSACKLLDLALVMPASLLPQFQL